MKRLIVLVILWPFFAAAQPAKVPLDTSFTVNGTFLKEVKNFPFIEIANPPVPGNIAVKENLVYKTISGRQLHLDVFYPVSKASKYPGVILIHGGGWRSGNRSQTIPIAQQLASRGYVTVAVEYRLSLEAKYPAAVQDLKAAVNWMRANASSYGLDTAYIASLGFSSGGQLAALVGTTNGDKKFEDDGMNKDMSSDVQAIIDVDGILAFKHPESEEGTAAAFWLGGNYDEKPGNWVDASPLSNVNRNTAPILFINSSLPRFHAGRDDMIKKLQSLKIYSEVHTFPNTPHPFWFFNPWFEPTVNFSAKFLEKVFGN